VARWRHTPTRGDGQAARDAAGPPDHRQGDATIPEGNNRQLHHGKPRSSEGGQRVLPASPNSAARLALLEGWAADARHGRQGLLDDRLGRTFTADANDTM